MIQSFDHPKQHSKSPHVSSLSFSWYDVTMPCVSWMSKNSISHMSIIVCVFKSDEDFASCLEYELAPRPLSLFDDISMRKTQKSVMYDVTESVAGSQQTYPEESTVVVDGGYFISSFVFHPHLPCPSAQE